MCREIAAIDKRPSRGAAPAVIVLMICFFALFAAGCASMSGVKTDAGRWEGSIELKNIAVAPFKKISSPDPSQRFMRCPLSGAFLRTGDIQGDAPGIVADILVGELKAQRKYVLITPDRVEGIYRRISAISFQDSVREKLRKTGEELEVDAILAGYVFCYTERKGYPYAVEQPASAVFCVHLLRVRDGVTLWKGAFDKTQSSLMENLFEAGSFFRGGGKWVTVQELSREGMESLLKTFPNVE